MKAFRSIFYGKIGLKLSSFLHIGGEEEKYFSLVTDGAGRFILPAAGIAGAVKAYLGSLGMDCSDLFGSGNTEKQRGTESRVYFYDGLCKNAVPERRNGIRLDPARGTVEKGGLYTWYFIGQGMETELCMQAFLQTEAQREEIEKAFACIADGIAEKRLVFGAKKSNGAGIFQVIGTGSRILELTCARDFHAYLQGVSEMFSSIPMVKYQKGKESLYGQSGKESSVMEFELTAEIPGGLLVKGNEEKEYLPELNGRQVNAVNVRKSVDQIKCCYIPSSTIKGAVRGYAGKVCHCMQIPQEKFVRLFGGETEKKKYRSHLQVQDVLIPEKESVILDRIKIDRWLGSVIDGAKMDQEVIYTKKGGTIKICVTTDLNDSRDRNLINALVFLTLRDMGLGLVSVGSGNSIGLGRLNGLTLRIRNTTLPFKEQGIDFQRAGQQGRDMEGLVTEWLREVKSYAV